MTLILELPTEFESALKLVARTEGHSESACATQILATHLLPFVPRASQTTDEEARHAAIDAVAGKYAWMGLSTANLRMERERDRIREERFCGAVTSKMLRSAH